jgi:hypothetical protein
MSNTIMGEGQNVPAPTEGFLFSELYFSRGELHIVLVTVGRIDFGNSLFSLATLAQRLSICFLEFQILSKYIVGELVLAMCSPQASHI